MANDEWYTPAPYIAAVRQVLGAIDLDPASCAKAQETVQAGRYYSAADNGLLLPWFGRVFCNPPYSRGQMDKWIGRLLAGYADGAVSAGILLCNACTSEQWFKPLWAFPICFPERRIRFLGPDGQPGPSPRYSNAFVYCGPDPARFARVFGAFGAVVTRYGAEVPL